MLYEAVSVHESKMEILFPGKLISDPKDHEALIKKLCREETEKAYYAGPKGKAFQLLEVEIQLK